MPELPEVETVRRGLETAIAGRKVVEVALRRADLRYPFPARFRARLEGRRIAAVRRRAKYLLLDLDDARTVIVHLGMSGRFVIRRREKNAAAHGGFEPATGAAEAHEHVVIRLDDGVEAAFVDPRRFGFMDLAATSELEANRHLARLGIEPLSAALTPEALVEMFKPRRTAVKLALLDQRLVAGIGNIYACEALFRAGLSPRRRAASIGPARAARLAAAIRNVLEDAIRAGGSSLRDFADVGGEFGYFQHAFDVYGRAGEPCRRCEAAAVRRIAQAGRSTFFCPACQR